LEITTERPTAALAVIAQWHAALEPEKPGQHT
jgi:hypothetical protein